MLSRCWREERSYRSLKIFGVAFRALSCLGKGSYKAYAWSLHILLLVLPQHLFAEEHDADVVSVAVRGDFLWFASGLRELERYRGMHVAIWDKQVIGYGEAAKEAYEMAEKRCLESELALAYIPEDEAMILWGALPVQDLDLQSFSVR